MLYFTGFLFTTIVEGWHTNQLRGVSVQNDVAGTSVFPTIDRTKAEKLLHPKNLGPGSFLVRFSQRTNSEVLSLKCSSPDGIVIYKHALVGKGLSVDALRQRFKESTFETIRSECNGIPRLEQEVIVPRAIIMFDFDRTIAPIHLYHQMGYYEKEKCQDQFKQYNDYQGYFDSILWPENRRELFDNWWNTLTREGGNIVVGTFGCPKLIVHILENADLFKYIKHVYSPLHADGDPPLTSKLGGSKAEKLLELVENEGLQASSGVLVDDDPENIQKAINGGLNTVHVTGNGLLPPANENEMWTWFGKTSNPR